MSGKRRLSTTVDAELIDAVQAAVAQGDAESVSSWVNDALRRKVEHGRRLQALDEFLSAFEAEHGAISDAEMRDAARAARARAVVTRGRPAAGRPARPPRRRG